MKIHPTLSTRSAIGALLLSSLLPVTVSAQQFPDPLIHFSFDEPTAWKSDGALTLDLASAGAELIEETPTGVGTSLAILKNGPQYAYAEDVVGLSGLTSFTLTAWIKVNGIGTDSDRIFSTLSEEGGIDFRIAGDPSDFTVSLTVNSLSGATSDSIHVEPGTWVFVAATYYSDDEHRGLIKFFIGGQNRSVEKLGRTQGLMEGRGGGAVLGTDGSEISRVCLGATPMTTSNRTPDLFMDDFRLYGEMLNETLLEEIAEAGR